VRHTVGQIAIGGVLALALAACVAAPKAEPRAVTALLDLSGDGRDIDAIRDAFAASVTARFGPRASLDAVTTDLQGQRFLCRDVPPVERRTDYLVAACELPRPHGLCRDLFVVSLRYAGGGVSNGLFVRADGAFERSCPNKGTN